jgi:hypothetical protein
MPLPGTGRIINGVVYDYSSITITIDGIPYQGITEISYSDTLEPGVLRGTSALMRGRTRGMYEAEASFSISLQDFVPLRETMAAKALGGGFMEFAFLISVSYREVTSPLTTDTIEGCRIKHVENSHSAGNSDGLVTKVDLSVYRIGWGGKYGTGVGGSVGGLIGL